MSKFKPGDRVKVIGSGTLNCILIGEEHIIKTQNTDGSYVFEADDHSDCHIGDEHLVLVGQDVYEVGQVLVDDDGDKRTVLAVVGDMVALSDWGDSELFGEWFSVTSVNKEYTVASSDPEVTELTLDEVAEKFGIEPSKLRIKKEA